MEFNNFCDFEKIEFKVLGVFRGVGDGWGWVMWGVGKGDRWGSCNFPRNFGKISGKMCDDPKTGN